MAHLENQEKKEEIQKFLEAKTEENKDIIQKTIGALGRWQIAICLLLCVIKLPMAWQQLNIIFIAPLATFTCVENETDSCSQNCSQHVFDRTMFTETIITEWDLVCDKAYLTHFSQTVTMFGALLGNMVFGYLSDKFGRKGPLMVAVILMVACGIGMSFTKWFALFLVLRCLGALATGGTMTTSFVLVMEIVGAKWRTMVGTLYHIPFNFGQLLLPVIAYFLRNWRHFNLAISLPPILLLSYYWILPESPRWLLTVGKKEEAIKILEKAAHHNGLPSDSIREDVNSHSDTKPKEKQRGNFLDLVRSRIILTYTLCISFNWFSAGLCFFGGAQYISQIGGNIFFNVALAAVTQLPAPLFCIWSLQAWGRKRTLIFGDLTSSISCLLIGLVPQDLTYIKTALSCVYMSTVCISFVTVYMYSGELFPTVVRNIGVSTGSMSARVGSMIAPFIAGLVLVREWLPVVIFGVAPLVGALLCLMLPETVNCKLPDTIEEAEELAKTKKKGK